DEDHLEKDYGRIADSSVAVAVMLALILLGAVASKAASSLVARFPALSRAAEALKIRIRRRLDIKPPEAPSAIASKMRPLEAKPPEAVGYPVRDMLTPDEQIAFDKFVAERKSDPHMAIDGKTPDQVRQMLRNQLEWVAEENAKRDEQRQWQGRPLGPQME